MLRWSQQRRNYIDCDDFDCEDTVACGGAGGSSSGPTEPENTEEACSDGVSNDGDPYIDCIGFDCDDTLPVEALASGSSGPTEPENTEEACSDGVSNDGDPYIDCDDFDCDDTLVCGGGEEGSSSEPAEPEHGRSVLRWRQQ